MSLDYIKSDGNGLDTQQGLRESNRFYKQYFDIVMEI